MLSRVTKPRSTASSQIVRRGHEVRQASELRAIERMQRLTGQLAEMSGATTEQRFAALRRVAADPDVVAYLAAPGREAASRAAALASLRGLSLTPTDTSIVAELRSTSEAMRIATRPELASVPCQRCNEPGRQRDPAASCAPLAEDGQESNRAPLELDRGPAPGRE